MGDRETVAAEAEAVVAVLATPDELVAVPSGLDDLGGLGAVKNDNRASIVRWRAGIIAA
jgi:hypothetical protein